MNIQNFINEIRQLPIERENTPENKTAIITQAKNIEQRAYDYLSGENFKPWSKCRGLEISHSLTEIRDAVLLKYLDFIGTVPPGIAVIAVGGYGRNELSPYSDIDILILQKEDDLHTGYINRFFYLLWDSGYKLGNSVRTIENVIGHAKKDITFLTGIFETRLLAGDENLLLQMNDALKMILAVTREDYAQSKVEEIHETFRQMKNAVFLKEPNLKESAGGLRCVHFAQWINFSFNFTPGFAGLEQSMPTLDYKKILVAYDYLLYIRNMLHFMMKRKEDTLYIDNHPKVAEYLGFKGDGIEQVRHLMKNIYSKMQDSFLLSFFVINKIYNARQKKGKKSINSDFYISNNQFFVENKSVPSVETAMSAAYEFTRGHYQLSPRLIQFMNDSSRVINDEHRQSKDIFNLFVQILSLDNSAEALGLMKVSDFIYTYIKPLSHIKHFIIYNPFHKYTVDQHSIEAIRALEQLRINKFTPFEREKVSKLIELAEKHKDSLWILKLTLLLHDIGKAFPGDHAKNGAEIANLFFSDAPLLYRYRGLVEFLIENHLLLSNISRRSDIQSLDVIIDLSRKFILSPYPSDYLEYLYLLTYADVYATNPSNYKGYTAALLYKVYQHTSMVLTGKIDRNTEDKIVKDKIDKISEIVIDKNIVHFIRSLGNHYANITAEDEIIADYTIVKSLTEDETRLEVRIFNEFLKIKIYTPDKLGVFANLSGILALNGANIVKANIYTYTIENIAPIAFDVFYITDIFGSNLNQTGMKNELQYWIERLENSLQNFINQPDILEKRIIEAKSRFNLIPSLFRKEAKIVFTRLDNRHLLMGVSANDRPALLYDISRYLSENGISVTNSIIDTIGWHIRDKFVIEIKDTITDTDLQRHKSNLIKLLTPPSEA